MCVHAPPSRNTRAVPRRPLENVNYNHLFYFHVVAETGSLGAAARRLSVTKPTISTQVRQLESFLGEPLFDRRGGRLRLNEAGRRAHRHTRTMFDAGRALLRDFRNDPEPDPGKLRVGIAPSVSRALARVFFVPLLSLEDARLHIRDGDHSAMSRALQDGELDLVISETAPQDASALGIDTAALADRRVVAVVGADGPDGELDEVLSELPVFHHPEGSAERWVIDRFLEERGIEPHIVGETADVNMLFEFASTGRCVAFVPDSVARERIHDGSVRAIAEVPRLRKRVHALYPKRTSRSLVAQAVELLREANQQ